MAQRIDFDISGKTSQALQEGFIEWVVNENISDTKTLDNGIQITVAGHSGHGNVRRNGMWISDRWKDYEVLDTSDGEKLERWGSYILVRPDPQVIWKTDRTDPLWDKADAIYHRSTAGGGSWQYIRKLPEEWIIEWNGLKMYVTPTNFKHTGVFPEQAANWKIYEKLIQDSGRSVSVLNLFGYTGIASLACLRAGASVCHVDASKGMVSQAKRNAQLNGLEDRPCRWIVDDCMKFVKREIRRGNKYDAIIMDPPSYGRGPSGEVWKLELSLDELLSNAGKLLSDNPLFFMLNSYTGGLSHTILDYMVKTSVAPCGKGRVFTDEIGLKVSKKDIVLPCGNTTIWVNNG